MEQTLRKSGVRRMGQADGGIVVALALELAKHGVEAKAVSRGCALTCVEDDKVMSFPEAVPLLMLEGVPTALNGEQGWEAVAKWFCEKKNRNQVGGQYDLHWKGEPVPLPNGWLLGVAGPRISSAMDRCMSEAQAAHMAKSTSPAQAPSRRLRF